MGVGINMVGSSLYHRRRWEQFVKQPSALTFTTLLSLSLVVGCSRDVPLDPGEPQSASHSELEDAVFRSDKERNAVDLGPPPGLALSLGVQSVSAASAASIPFAPEPGPFAHSAGVYCDDCTRDGLPIGFSFTFFDDTYTAFNVSSNGFISFTPGTSSGCCSGGTIPAADGLNNLIAAAWTDLYPPGGGGVFYETRGRAPNRYLIVAYENIPWCCESGTNRVTTQIMLYEGSNAVEIHTANQSVGHIYTQGVENASGTRADFIPGRVAANYGYVNDAVRFTTATSWATRAPLPTPRRGHAVWATNGLVYAIGGTNSAGAALTSVQAYNPTTNTWATRASLPAARQNGNGASTINNVIYLAGGHDAAGALTRTLYAYNPGTNRWSTRAQIPIPSSCGGSTQLAGKLYVFSGCTRSSTGTQIAAGRLHRYDPSTNTWTALRSAPAVHFQPVFMVTSGKLYLVGGNNGAGSATGRVDMYDPSTNTWTQRATMPTARVAATGTSIGGKLYVFGGRNGTTYLNTVQVYDPVTNSWSTRASMPNARAGLGVAGVSGSLYIIGGRNGTTTALATNERFTP